MAARSPFPEVRAESREARTGVGMTRPAAIDRSTGRPRTELPVEWARDLRKRLTPQEARLWVARRKLRPAGSQFRRQIPIARFIVDFACLKRGLVVECDGGQHGSDEHAHKDEIRDATLGKLGFRVLRFWNIEVDRNLSGVIDKIVAALETACPHPGPPLCSGSALPSGEGQRA